MQIKLNVSEAVDFFKAIQEAPSKLFELVRLNVQEEVGNYLSKLMDTELTHFLGRDKYEHGSKDGNHRNGSYSRQFCVKGIGDVELKIPRDRHGEFQTAVIERGQRYEAAIAEDMALMYLTGITTRNLSLLSNRLESRDILLNSGGKALGQVLKNQFSSKPPPIAPSLFLLAFNLKNPLSTDGHRLPGIHSLLVHLSAVVISFDNTSYWL